MNLVQFILDWEERFVKIVENMTRYVDSDHLVYRYMEEIRGITLSFNAFPDMTEHHLTVEVRVDVPETYWGIGTNLKLPYKCSSMGITWGETVHHDLTKKLWPELLRLMDDVPEVTPGKASS